MGIAVPGDRKFYMNSEYGMTSAGVETTYKVKEGDIITDRILGDPDNDHSGSIGQWRVVKIIKEWYEPNQSVYMVAIVRNINLDGSQ